MKELLEKLAAVLKEAELKTAELSTKLAETETLKQEAQAIKEQVAQEREGLRQREEALKDREALVTNWEELKAETKALEDAKTAHAKKVETDSEALKKIEAEQAERQAHLDAREHSISEREKALDKEREEYKQRIKMEVLQKGMAA